MFRLLSRRSPRVFPRLQSRGYNQNYFQNLQPPVSRFKKTVSGAFWVASLTAVAYYLWWPKHTFPSSVATILRKGIIAESDKGEKDFQLALKYYLQALDECVAQKVEPISDEYTGVQLKIAEMYERLNMPEQAAFVYNEIATLYLSTLKAEKNTPEAARIKSIDHRAHIIQKDLRVAIKLVTLNQNNPSLSKAILITHLLIASEEVNKKLGVAKTSLFEAPELGHVAQNNDGASGSVAGGTGVSADDTDVLVVETNPEAWSPFAAEFFQGLQMLSAICISVGDINAASNISLSTTSKMLLAGVPPDMLLLSQCNTASLLYFQMEQLQAQQQQMHQKFAKDAGIDYESVKALHDPSKPPVPAETAVEIRQKLDEAASDADKAKYEQLSANRAKLLEMVQATYDSVIHGAKQLPQDVVADTPAIAETVALATYGLAVLQQHLGNYDRAERMFREARVRSRACGYDALIAEIERELARVQEQRRSLQQK